MSVSQWTVEWLNHNAQRAYPFADIASRRDTTGDLVLPNALLVDLSLPVPFQLSAGPGQFFVSRVVLAGDSVTLTFSWRTYGTTTTETVASAGVSISGFQENTPIFVDCTGILAGCRLCLVFGDVAEVANQPAGAYDFTVDATAIDPHCLHPQLRAVSGIRLQTGNAVGPLLSGELGIVAGNGISLTSVLTPEGLRIRLDSVPGDVTSDDPCACIDPVPDCIRSINGQTGEHFVFVTDSCLSLSVEGSTINLEDICSRPCCDNQELLEVYRVQRQLETTVYTLQQYVARLSDKIQSLHNALLVSTPGVCPTDTP